MAVYANNYVGCDPEHKGKDTATLRYNKDSMEKRSSVRQHYQNEATTAQQNKQYQDRTAQLDNIENTMVQAFNALIGFIDGKTTKTEVVNQLKSISTPDVDKVVQAVSKLDKDILANKLDLSPIVKELQQIKREASLIPKSHPDKPEPTEKVKVTNLSEIALDTKSLEKAIKELKLAPTIDVKPTDVNVDAPDLKPLQNTLLDVIKAIKNQKYPDIPATDLKPTQRELEAQTKELKKHTKQFKELIEKPVGGGGGGGGNGSPYVDSTGKIVNVTINPDGSIPVTTSITNYTTRIAEDSGDSNLTYIGNAVLGASEASAVWQIKRLDATTGLIKLWSGGTDAFDKVWDNRESGSYS